MSEAQQLELMISLVQDLGRYAVEHHGAIAPWLHDGLGRLVQQHGMNNPELIISAYREQKDGTL